VAFSYFLAKLIIAGGLRAWTKVMPRVVS
jgi:hypothetical protein